MGNTAKGFDTQGKDYLKLVRSFVIKHRKPIIITGSVTILQVLFGFDPQFCAINIIWLFV